MADVETQPSDTASEQSGVWTARPHAARAVRWAAVAAPLLLAWFAVAVASPHLFRPDGRWGVVWWAMQAAPIGAAVATFGERAFRRLAPLALLLDLSLSFPDAAPSRFAIALRTGTVGRLRARAVEARQSGLGAADPAAASQRAVELLAGLAHHDRATRGHTERVRAYSDMIAVELGLEEDERARLAWGALLHDVGKLTVPSTILNKKGRPSEVEWAIVEQHPTAGRGIVAALEPWLGTWAGAVGQHHERWDGTGYPDRLAGTDITLSARIVAVADAFDVMTSTRSYRRSMDPEMARTELVNCAGSQFDPEVVRAFLAVSLPSRVRLGPFVWVAELIRSSQWASSATTVVAASSIAVTGGLAGTTLGLPDLAYIETAAPTVPLDAVADDDGVAVAAPLAVVAESAASEPAAGSTLVTTNIVAPLVLAPTVPEVADDDPEIAADEPLVTMVSTPAGSTPLTAPVATEAPTTAVPSTTTTIRPTSTQPPTTQPPTTLSSTTQPATTLPPTTLPPTTQPPTTLPPTTQAPTTQGALTAVDDHATTEAFTRVVVDVLANDSSGAGLDTDSVEIVSGPSGAWWLAVHQGTIIYRPRWTQLGTDSLTYRVCDLAGNCATATLSIEVAARDW